MNGKPYQNPQITARLSEISNLIERSRKGRLATSRPHEFLRGGARGSQAKETLTDDVLACIASVDGREGGEKEEDFPFPVFFFPPPQHSLRLSRRLMMSILLECSFKREFYCKQREVKRAQ